MEGEQNAQQNMNQNTGSGAPAGGTPAQDSAQASAGNNRMLMGILAYIGILVVIPYLLAKNDPFVKFHIRQGLVLVVIELAVWVLGMVMWILIPVLGLVNIAMLVFSIIGIVNVVQNQEKELPFLGQFAKHFNI